MPFEVPLSPRSALRTHHRWGRSSARPARVSRRSARGGTLPGAGTVLRGARIVSITAGDAGSDARVVDLGDITIVPGIVGPRMLAAGTALSIAGGHGT